MNCYCVQPWVREEETILPGVTERRRRSLEEIADQPGTDYENVYKVSRHVTEPVSGIKSEELCMLIKIKARITINFEARPPSPVKVDTKDIDLPEVPDRVNGTCVLETEIAKIFLFWSGYNFSMEFIKNPEGNSYYLNRVMFQYNTKHPDLARDFQYAAAQGLVHLETKPGQNYFFTPLGKSFVCRRSEDQGPLKLYNLASKQIEGSLDMWNTKFQPFVVRAGGSWGGEKPCLDAEIRRARIEFWPFASAAILFLCSGIFFGGYAAKRTWFTNQKVDYGSYEEGNQKVEHEMEMVRQQSEPGYQQVNLNDPVEPQAAPADQSRAANPFQQKASNPFQGAANPFNN